MLDHCITRMPDVEVTMLCDLLDTRLEKGQALLEERNRPRAIATKNYQDVLDNPEIDAVLLMTGWDNRPTLAKQAMLAGKYTAFEVGCANTLEECFELVEIHEKTGVPMMMLENCCYSRLELMILNMVKQGLLGELAHCTGGYCHYLNDCELFKHVAENEEVPHYRLGHYINRNTENYPTHELGPICKILNINRGNRLVKLSAFASKSIGLKQYAKDHFGEDSEYAKIDYKQGDIINTIITCANGETILLTLDTTLPRAYYSRNISARGTHGMVTEEGNAVFFEGMKEPTRNNLEEYYEKYDHPLQKEVQATIGASGINNTAFFGAHADGVDWLVFRAFIESVKNGTNTPIDAYDSATWLAIGVLAEQSIANGGMPVEIPDFTNGKWKNRKPVVKSKYCLDEIIIDDSTPVFPNL